MAADTHTIAGLPASRFFAAVSAGIVIAIASVYLPVVDFEFLEYDDKSYVFQNPDLQDGLTPKAARDVFTRSYVSSWHPVAMLSHALDVSLFGMDPGMHHLTNVLFHLANSLLVLLVWYRLTGRPIESAVLAVLWAIHPQHVEPVAWIASRKDLVSTFFFLLCLLAYAGYARRGGRARYLAVAGTLTLGLLAKPMLVTVPFILLLLDFWPLYRFADRNHVVRCVVEKIPLFLICIAVSAITQVVQTTGGAVKPLSELSLQTRLLNIPVTYTNYVTKTFWPVDLSVFYPHRLDDVAAWQVAAGCLLVAAVSLLAILQWRRRPYLFVGWFWFVGTLVPVIGLVQFGSHGMADRYTYLPHLGLFTALIWSIAEIGHRRPTTRSVLAFGVFVLVLASTTLSSRYLFAFRNDVTLFTQAIAATRPHAIPWINLGYGYQVYGWYDEALDCYDRALRLDGKPVQLLRNIAAAHAERGAIYSARDAFEDILDAYPDDPHARGHVDSMNAAIAARETEWRSLEDAIQQGPKDTALRAQLASEYIAAGRVDDAVQLYGQIGAMPPGLAAHVFSESKREGVAAQALRAAIELRPNDPELQLQLVRVLHRDGRDAEARPVLRDLIHAHPEFTDAVRYKRTLGW